MATAMSSTPATDCSTILTPRSVDEPRTSGACGSPRHSTGLHALDSPRDFRDPVYAMAFARIVTHYVRHNAWLEDGVLLRGVASLTHIAGTPVNGRFDFQAPIGNAWELHRVWPNSAIVIVDNAGHGGSAPISEA